MKDLLIEQGYKKNGKKYTPPILQLGNFNSVDWIDELVPELYWIGILQNKLGYLNGSQIASRVANLANEIIEDKTLWFALISNYSRLEIEKQNKLKQVLIDEDILDKLQYSLNFMRYFYPNFPLNFLLENTSYEISLSELANFKLVIDSIFDRTSSEANWIQAIALDIYLGTSNDVKFSPESALAEFPKFEEYPNTEISIQVASSIRGFINITYISICENGVKLKWNTDFWETSRKIDKCK